MKNLRFIFLVLVSIVAISPLYTKAKSITNYNGVVISEEEYNNFSKIYSPEYIMLLEEDEYIKLKDLDYSDVKTETKYVETTYNPHLNIVTEREISKGEFEMPAEPNLADRGDSCETTYKIMTMSIVGGSTWNYATLTTTWKGIPSTRSFDVSGFRAEGMTVRNGSQTGKQIYRITGNSAFSSVDYSWNGTNIKRFDNGFGISMNIVNDNINYLQATISGDFTPSVSDPALFGSYQHAVADLSLATSQNYSIGSAGLGGVFIYPYNTSVKYDGMTGLKIVY